MACGPGPAPGVEPAEGDADAYADHLRAWKAVQEPDLSTREGLQAELDTQMQAWREASNRIDLASAKLVSHRLRTEFPDARYLTLDESDPTNHMKAGQLLAADMKPIMVTDAQGYTELAVDAMRDEEGPYSSREDQSELEEDLARVANFQTDGQGRATGIWESWCTHHRSEGYVLDLKQGRRRRLRVNDRRAHPRTGHLRPVLQRVTAGSGPAGLRPAPQVAPTATHRQLVVALALTALTGLV